MSIYSLHNPAKDRHGTFPIFEKISVTTNVSGNASVTSDNYVCGELLGIIYDDGSVTTSTIAVISVTSPIILQLDSYDVNNNDAYRIPKILTQNSGGTPSTDNYSPIYLNSQITVTVTGGQASKTFYVYIVYK